MPIRRRNPRKKVILAAIQGLVIGVVGVLLFGFILSLANDKKIENESESETTNPSNVKEKEEKVEVTADALLPFKAKQYGMFTTKESAISFMASEPTLVKASIVQVENQFFIWSELFVNDVPVAQPEALPSFVKNLYISTKSCEDPKVKKIMTLLQEENISKNFFDSTVKKEDYPADLTSIVQAVSTFSDVSSVMRLHVFSHYFEQNKCVNLSF